MVKNFFPLFFMQFNVDKESFYLYHDGVIEIIYILLKIIIYRQYRRAMQLFSCAQR